MCVCHGFYDVRIIPHLHTPLKKQNVILRSDVTPVNVSSLSKPFHAYISLDVKLPSA